MSALSRLKVASWLRATRLRGRGIATLYAGPSVPSGFRGTMRSASRIASSTSLVMSTTVALVSAQIAAISSCSLARVKASSADSGSSSSSTCGCMASARATATRWRMPPDSSAGRRSLAWESPTMRM